MITEATNAQYDQSQANWSLTKTFLEGSKSVESSLVRGHFENVSRHRRRKKLADWRPLTRHIMMRLVGQIYTRTEDIERQMGPISDDWLSAAGTKDEDWAIVVMQMALTLATYNAAVVTVNPTGSGAEVSVASPLAMTRWTDTSSIIKGQMAVDAAIDQDQEMIDTYTLYEPDSWAVYVEDGDSEQLIDSNNYGRTFSLGGRPHAPVLRLEMPWQQSLGLEVAMAHRAIYRMQSAVDAGLYEALASTTIQAAVGSDQELIDAFANSLKDGDSFVPYDTERGEHKPLALPTGPLETGRQTIDDKRDSLYEVLGQTMADNAQMSATQAALNAKSGIQSTLSTLALTMQDAEERVLRMVAQALDVTQAEPTDIAISYPTDYSQITMDTLTD